MNTHYSSLRYGAVLRACRLDRDLALLPLGDGTLLRGNTSSRARGVSLSPSAGLKARLGLARAAYRVNDADLFLLDDPLAALDPKVDSRG